MSLYKSADEIKQLAEGGRRLNQVLAEVVKVVRPGISGLELTRLAEKLLLETGGQLAFKGYGQPPYPSGLCVSVNNCVVHGIPNEQPLKEGDLVSLDIGLKYQGLYTDKAVTVAVGQVNERAQELLEVTKRSLDLALDKVGPGVGLKELARLVQKEIEAHGFGVVRDFAGHGVGHAVHEEPSVPNFVQPGPDFKLQPMVTMGDWRLKILDNGWDAVTLDGSLAAHFEDTVAVTDSGHLIITR